jgi:hypothetical protein
MLTISGSSTASRNSTNRLFQVFNTEFYNATALLTYCSFPMACHLGGAFNRRRAAENLLLHREAGGLPIRPVSNQKPEETEALALTICNLTVIALQDAVGDWAETGFS